jgi:integrase
MKGTKGNIRKRKDGRWEGRYRYNGNIKYLYSDDKKNIEEKLKKIKSQIFLGDFVEQTKVTVSEWLEEWLFEYKKKIIKNTTFANYKQIIDLYITPKLGNFIISELTTIQIQYYINNIAHSSRTIKYAYILLKMALEHAVAVKLIKENPCKNVILPKQKKSNIKILDEKEFEIFIDTIKTHNNGCAFYLAIATGMRKGEILALKWCDIDFKNNLIFIEKTLSRVKLYDEDRNSVYKTIIGDCKTDKSKRIIPIFDDLKKWLQVHYARMKLKFEKKGKKILDEDYIFLTEKHNPLSPRNFSKQFYAILKKCNIEKNKFHVLRHTYASFALSKGMELKVLSELLGHSSYSFTADVYCQILPNKKKEEVLKLQKIFKL